MPDLCDDDLMQLFADGEAEAFDVLFDRHARAVYHLARTLLARADLAEDAMQETFLSVAKSTRSYRAQGRFKAWLLRICRNLCLNRLAAQRARRNALAECGLTLVEPASDEPTPADQAQAGEQARIVRQAVARLPEPQQAALTLYAFEQMTYREIAEVLDAPINTVKTHIHRERAALARALQPQEQESRP